MTRPKPDDYGNMVAYITNIHDAPDERRMVYVENDGTVNIGVDALTWGIEENDQRRIDGLNRTLTAIYEVSKNKWIARKKKRTQVFIDNHWYTNPGPLRDKIIAHTKTYAQGIIEDYIEYNPTSVLIPYYRSLITRVNTVTPRYNPVTPAKLAKLPQYDEYNDNLIGSKTKFLNLIMAIYKPVGKKKSDVVVGGTK